MTEYQIVCINLEKRSDRKQNMLDLFLRNNIMNFQFYNGVDGHNLDMTNPHLSFFKHENSVVRRRGVLGCALSHYNVWLQLLNDEMYDKYVIVEDDIRVDTNFKSELGKIINKMTPDISFVFLGIHVTKENYSPSRNIYQYDRTYDIYPLTRQYFTGGLFGYVITKEGARKLINYIQLNGIKRAIDYVVYDSDLQLYETHPQIVMSDSVQDSDFFVDSNIQRDLTTVDFPHLDHNYNFDDYDFYPSLDSFGNDIMQSYADIPNLKKIADSMDNCVGFNTYGWLKYDISSNYKFIFLNNRFYTPDGLYIKKSFNRKTNNINNKLRILKTISQQRSIRVFVGDCARVFSWFLVDIILSNFPSFEIVSSHQEEHDILINNLCDSHYYINPSRLNIVISGEPWNVNRPYDISIDTKYKSTVKNTIYYPFMFASMREHRKSINPKDYVNTREKFCAFMYSQSYPHRIKYFDLLSKYKRVDALGRCRKNVDIDDTRDKNDSELTFNDIAVEIYTNYKFVIAVENTMLGGYTTEKIINPLIANSIPIYWGDADIFKYVNKNRIVYVPDFNSDAELLERVIYLDTNTEAYNSVVNESIFVDPTLTLEIVESNLKDEISRNLKL